MNQTLNEPTIGKPAKRLLDGVLVDCEIFNVREFNGVQEYALMRAPHSREFTRVSYIKTTLFPIKDDYANQPKWLRGQYR